MTAHELLTELRSKGVEIKASSEDRLVIDAPKGTITEELRAALTGNKADLLTILKAEQVQKGAEAVSHSEARSVRVPERSPVDGMESLAPARTGARHRSADRARAWQARRPSQSATRCPGPGNRSRRTCPDAADAAAACSRRARQRVRPNDG